MINQVHAANVSGEPAKRIVQVLCTSARPPVHPYVDLWAMQLCYHLCREYPLPEHCSVVELQQRVMASALGNDPDAQVLKVRRLAAGGRWIRTIGTAQETTLFAAPVRSPQFAFRNKNRLFRARDRWFESISLQQGVTCELGY